MSTKFLSQVGNLLINKLLFKKCLFLVVQALFKNMDLGKESLLIRVFTRQVNSIWMFLWILKLLRKLLNFHFLGVQFFFKLEHFFCEFRNFRNLLVNNLELTLTLLELELDHSNLLFFLPDLLLAVFEDVLLDVALFVENTELIVSVNKLDTHVISRLAGVLILVDEIVHLLLERVDDQVELVTLVDQLANRGELRAELELLAIQFGAELVTLGHSLGLLLQDIDQVAVFLSALVLQDVDFVLQDLHALLHLGQVLTAGLNLAHVLVPGVLHLFVKCNEGVQLEVRILLLLRQVQYQQLLDLELSTGLTSLCGCLRSCTSHLGPDGHQEVDLDDEHGLTSLHVRHKRLLKFNLLLELLDAVLAHIKVQALLDELADIDHLVFLVVGQTMVEFSKLRSQLVSHLDHSRSHCGQLLDLGLELARLLLIVGEPLERLIVLLLGCLDVKLDLLLLDLGCRDVLVDDSVRLTHFFISVLQVIVVELLIALLVLYRFLIFLAGLEVLYDLLCLGLLLVKVGVDLPNLVVELLLLVVKLFELVLELLDTLARALVVLRDSNRLLSLLHVLFRLCLDLSG